MKLVKPGGEHTIDLDLLPAVPTVLDVGCRGFAFDYDILKFRPQAKIFALEPDPAVLKPDDLNVTFLNSAMTHIQTPNIKWQGGGDGEGSYIVTGPGHPGYDWPIIDPAQARDVENVTLQILMIGFGIQKFDLVKLDCEGSEFGILENWPGPIATQISVEFHDYANRNRWNMAYFLKLFAGPLKDYRVVQFEDTPIGPTKALGHWDSLLVLA